MEIKSRKIKSEFLQLASLSAEKVGETAGKVFGNINRSKSIRSILFPESLNFPETLNIPDVYRARTYYGTINKKQES